jgi:hypothetical protein
VRLSIHAFGNNTREIEGLALASRVQSGISMENRPTEIAPGSLIHVRGGADPDIDKEYAWYLIHNRNPTPFGFAYHMHRVRSGSSL